MFTEDLKRTARKHHIEYIGILPFEHEEYHSMAVMLLPYYAGEFHSCLSRYARGKDYHIVGRQVLGNILDELKEKNQFSYRIYVDASPFDERKLALDAGLGVLGKNNLVLNQTYGSYVFIVTALLTLKTTGSARAIEKCVGCNACISACPNRAIGESGVDYTKCLSRINQEKNISKQEAGLIRKTGFCWGCDQCQLVCPYNKDNPISPISAFTKDLVLSISNIEDYSNRGFMRDYRDRAFSYKGKQILARNFRLIEKRKESSTDE